MRKEKIIQGEYYHVLNRGNNKQDIFKDEKDWIRLLFLILYFQSPVNLRNISREVNYFAKHKIFNVPKNKIKEITDNRIVIQNILMLKMNYLDIYFRVRLK